MNKLIETIDNNKKRFWYITIAYIVFFGLFSFPIIPIIRLVGIIYLFGVIYTYMLLALFFSRLVDNNPIKVFLVTACLSVVGMMGRYFLEYGEYSNTINFTGVNIAIQALLIPAFTVAGYMMIRNLNLGKK